MFECPACQKKFYCYNVSKWAYRIHKNGQSLTFCNYACLRKAENFLMTGHEKAVQQIIKKQLGEVK